MDLVTLLRCLVIYLKLSLVKCLLIVVFTMIYYVINNYVMMNLLWLCYVVSDSVNTLLCCKWLYYDFVVFKVILYCYSDKIQFILIVFPKWICESIMLIDSWKCHLHIWSNASSIWKWICVELCPSELLFVLKTVVTLFIF